MGPREDREKTLSRVEIEPTTVGPPTELQSRKKEESLRYEGRHMAGNQYYLLNGTDLL